MPEPSYAMKQANFAEMYERWLVGPLFRPWADDLLDRAKLSSGDRLLDLACGTGIVARTAVERLSGTGVVVAVDLSEQMLAVGAAIAPSIDWRAGDAGALPVGDSEAFDVVVCQQGLQFFADKSVAVREMRRVLAPNGRLALSVWRDVEEMPFFETLQRVGERHVGAVDDQRYGFGDPAGLAALAEHAGFCHVQVETVSRTLRFPETEPLVRLNAMALVGMSAAGNEGEEEKTRLVAAIVADSAGALAPFRDGPGLAFEMSTNALRARAPDAG